MWKHIPEVDVVGGAIREFNDEGTIDRVKNMPKTQGRNFRVCESA